MARKRFEAHTIVREIARYRVAHLEWVAQESTNPQARFQVATIQSGFVVPGSIRLFFTADEAREYAINRARVALTPAAMAQIILLTEGAA